MIIADKTILVTGANRGIGRALTEETLSRGAKRVYAGTRVPLTQSLRALLAERGYGFTPSLPAPWTPT